MFIQSFKKITTHFVLVSFIGQTVLPTALFAMEGGGSSGIENKTQYRMSIHISGPKNRVNFEIGKRTSGDQMYERLYKSFFENGKTEIIETPSQIECEKNSLLDLFSKTTLQQSGEVCQLPGIGTLKIYENGTVAFKQVGDFVDLHELSLETTGLLCIQSLSVPSLSLRSQKTRFLGAVITNHIDLKHTLVNEAGLQTKTISGIGKFVNKGILHLEGTQKIPSQLSVRHFINKKSKRFKLAPKMEGSYVIVSKENQTFDIHKKSSLHIRELFRVEGGGKSPLINEGMCYFGKTELERAVMNSNFWQSRNILLGSGPFTTFNNTEDGQLHVLNEAIFGGYFANKGTVEVKKNIDISKGVNKGTLKATILEVTESLRNQGVLSIRDLTGSGSLENEKNIQFVSSLKQPAHMSLERFINKNLSENQRGNVQGTFIILENKNSIFEKNTSFENYGDLTVDHFEIDRLYKKDDVHKTPTQFMNKGSMKIGHFSINQLYRAGNWQNLGLLEAEQFYFQGNIQYFTNTETGILKITDEIQSTAWSFVNAGEIQDTQRISIRKGINRGTIQAHKFITGGSPFQNDSSEIGCSFHNTKKAVLEVKKGLRLKNSLFQNDGDVISNGLYRQTLGEFINAGRWDHQGNIIQEAGKLTNNTAATIIWKNGKWAYSHSNGIINKGHWLFDQIKGDKQPIKIQNENHLELIESTLIFSTLINKKQLIFRSGDYEIFDGFQSDGLISFLNTNWILTDDKKGKEPNRLVLPGKVILRGKIESEKTLTYDIERVPPQIRSKENILFTKRHASRRNIKDLEKLNTAGEVRFFSGALTIDKNYDFAHIGKLYLSIGGDFINPKYFLKSPSLTMIIYGALSCGSSNDELGIIAATKGPLKISATHIDARFAQIWGKMGANLTSRKSNILIGAPKCGVTEDMNYAHNISNGAFVASGGELIMDAAQTIDVTYGSTLSVNNSELRAGQKITNLAGDLQSLKKVIINSPEYLHTRQIPTCFRFVTDGMIYAGVKNELTSGPAIIRASDNIIFNVEKLDNVASVFLSGKKILHNNQGITRGENRYTETTLTIRSCGYGGLYVKEFYIRQRMLLSNHMLPRANSVRGTYACATKANDEININTGKVQITGNFSAGQFIIKANEGLFSNSSKTRIDVQLSKPMIVNVTKDLCESVQKNPGLFQIDSKKNITSVFSCGESYAPQGNEIVYFGNTLPTFSEMKMSRNPLSSINLDLIILQKLADVAGRAFPGQNLTKNLYKNTKDWNTTHPSHRQICKEEDLCNIEKVMLMTSLQKVGTILEKQILLVIPPNAVNPNQSEGDVTSKKIFVRTKDNQTHQGMRYTTLDFEKKRDDIEAGVTLESTNKDVFLETQKYTTFSMSDCEVIHQEHAMPQMTINSPLGPVKISGHTGVKEIGLKVNAPNQPVHFSSLAGDVERFPLILKRTVHSQHTKNEWFSSKTETSVATSYSSILSTISGDIIDTNAGRKIHLKAPQDTATTLISFTAPETIIESVIKRNKVQNSTQTDSLFSEQSTESSQETPCVFQGILQAPTTVFNGDEATISGIGIVGNEIIDNTTKGIKVQSKKKEMRYRQEMSHTSLLAWGNSGVEGGQEVAVSSQLLVNQIIHTINDIPMKLETGCWDETKTQIIGNFEKTLLHLKKWERKWNDQHQVVPNEALPVIALAVAIFTQGMGVHFFAGLINTISATTGMTLSTAGIAMVNAAFTSVCSQGLTSYLRTGDPLQAIQELTSEGSLKALCLKVASAGVTSEVSEMLGRDLTPGVKPFIEHLKDQSLIHTIDSVFSVGSGQETVKEAFTRIVKEVPLKAVACTVVNGIGKARLNLMNDTLAHGLLGGLCGYAKSSNSKGFKSGAMGAMSAKLLARALLSNAQDVKDTAIHNLKKQNKPLTLENIQKATDLEITHRQNLAKIGTGIFALLGKFDTSIAIDTGSHALDYDNSLRHIIYESEEYRNLLTETSLFYALTENEDGKEDIEEKPRKKIEKREKKRDIQREDHHEDLYWNMLDTGSHTKSHN